MTDRQPNEPVPQDFQESAQKSQDASIADESAAYATAASQVTDDKGAREGAGGAQSSEKPVEGDEETSPPQPGSPQAT